MQVSKWGNSLAVRLPSAVVEALELKAGDEIEIEIADERQFGIARKPTRPALLQRLRQFRDACRPTSSSTGKTSMPASFFDTNVLLYTISDDVLKADRADHILAEGGAITSKF